MAKVITDERKIKEIFDRGIVEEILPSRETLFKRLTSGEQLRIYIGADATSDSLHLSHAKNFMFLEELRQLGHEVILLFGDFTAQIGDPTDKNAARVQLAEEEVKKNVTGWLTQIRPLLDFDDKQNPPRIEYNSKWLAPLNFKEIVQLASHFTVQQMMKRDMFEKRIREDIPIHLHEFLYPLMQGYDSVALDVDVELCGTDQIFNALAGRTLVKRLKSKEKFVIALNLMANPKTGELMSKSKGTGVFLSSSPKEMFGAIMAQPDEMIEVLLINCTRIPLDEKESLFAKGPREAKAQVAFEIIKKLHGEKVAQEAQESFEKLFSKKELSDDIPELYVAGVNTTITIVEKSAVAESKSEARRLIEQGAVEIDSVVKKDPKENLLLKGGEVLKIGKRHFFRLKL